MATELDMKTADNADLRRTVLDIYTPTYGPEWESFFDANCYVRIEPERMFTFHLE